MTLHALTLWPEWAWAVCHLGESRPARAAQLVLDTVGDGRLAPPAGRDVKSRPARAAQMVLDTVGDGWLAIHAGAHRDGCPPLHSYLGSAAARAIAARAHGLSRAPPLHRSAIVAVARVGAPPSASPWGNADLAQLGLHNVRTLPSPIPCSRKQGLWTVPPELAATIYAQVTP